MGISTNSPAKNLSQFLQGPSGWLAKYSALYSYSIHIWYKLMFTGWWFQIDWQCIFLTDGFPSTPDWLLVSLGWNCGAHRFRMSETQQLATMGVINHPMAPRRGLLGTPRPAGRGRRGTGRAGGRWRKRGGFTGENGGVQWQNGGFMAKMRVLWAKMVVLCDLETKLDGFPVKIGWFCLKLNFHSDELW